MVTLDRVLSKTINSTDWAQGRNWMDGTDWGIPQCPATAHRLKGDGDADYQLGSSRHGRQDMEGRRPRGGKRIRTRVPTDLTHNIKAQAQGTPLWGRTRKTPTP